MRRSVQEREDFQSAPHPGVHFYVFHRKKPPFGDSRITTALSVAVARESIQVGEAWLSPAGTLVPRQGSGYPGIKGIETNVERAKSLLAEAGYPNGRGFPRISILYHGKRSGGEDGIEDAINRAIAEGVRQDWKLHLGIDCDLQEEDFPTYLSRLRSGDFFVAAVTQRGVIADPLPILQLFATNSPINSQGFTRGSDGINRSHFGSARLDRLLEQAGNTPVGLERAELLMEAERLIVEQEAIAIPLFHFVSANLIDTEQWGGWFANILDHHPPRFIYRAE
jgi:oligopeptide transport system substrate-binding protein